MKNIYRILVGKPGGKRSMRQPGSDGSLRLKWILNTRESQ
jgi:hypothetical protein